jgi:lactate dehydrogenase-like 2-hydroxyacid dehydrogenase
VVNRSLDRSQMTFGIEFDRRDKFEFLGVSVDHTANPAIGQAVPHLGSAAVEVREEMANIVVDNILALLEGRRPPNIVNPEVLAP